MIAFSGRKANSSRNALIVFTREPEPGRTKTRLMPYYSPEQCAELHRCMIKDISKEMRKTDADVIVAFTCGDDSEPEFLRRKLGRNALLIRQRGDDIGSKMLNAINDVLGLGYENVILIGTDIPEVRAKTVNAAISLLADSNVVLGATADGGYYLIGMKAAHPEAFNVKSYGCSSVFEETVSSLREAGLTVGTVDTYSDIDTPDDIAGFRRRMRKDAHLRKTCTGRFLAETAKISVIAPVYNEASLICGLIRQLEPYKDECEIIIVDGGSTDGTPDLAKKAAGDTAGDYLILETNKSRALQMNAGAMQSTGDILFFLHCDCTLPKHFTDEIRRVMAAHEWGCFKVKFLSTNFFMLTNSFFSNCRAQWRGLPFGDQGIFVDRDLFFETGKFPDIPLMEDYKFSMVMRCRKGIGRPGVTQKRLITSARRYGMGTLSILKTEAQMWKLRHMFRRGASAGMLKDKYEDIR